MVSKLTKVLAVSMIMVLVLGMVACSSEKPAEKPIPETPKRTSLVYGLMGDPMNLDPSKTTDQMSRAVWTQMYDTCARKMDDGTYVPMLAESWSVSPDGLVVTLKIRDNAYFHDGTKLTAEDVAFSLNRLAASPSTSGMMVSMSKDSAVALDNTTCQVTISAPYGAILDVIFIEGRIVSKKAIETMGEEAFAQNPIGTGPYKFVSRKTGESIVLTANDKYYKGAPTIKDITFKIITDNATAVVALEKGELDFLSHAPLTARAGLVGNPKIKWYETPIAGLIYLVFNVQDGRFADKTLRQAIQAGIDKDIMVIGGVEGHGKPITQMIPEACFGYQEDFKDIPYDLQKAKALLSQAGYPNGFKMVLKTQENATYAKPTQVLQGQLNALGIDAEIQMMERGTFFGEYRISNYEMMIMHWTTPLFDADYLWQLCHSKELGKGNKNKINNPELDAMLDLGRQSSDPAVRAAAYRRVNEIIQEEVYFLPIYTFMAPCAANKDLKGVKADSLYKFYVVDWSW